ncbi:uncharacterized protein [Asterias amurensis]|uniref:uncharacterized protein n=1 Tax=Asterias amurensis TaxID=7602 RepID=UPI003AB37093
MNWVGGVRNRLKTKDEKRRQKEFFEKMKYGSKVGRLKRTSDSPSNTSLPTSLDLLSLQAADFSAKKFRQSDPEQKSKMKVKKIEMDRSKGMFSYHHHHQELPMSPDETPSKLQLQEPDESPMLSYPSYEGHPHTANNFYNINQSSEMLKKNASYMIKPEESESYPEYQSTSPFQSTPLTRVDDAPQQPLKHQGKHFEDLFFSFMPPGCDNETVSSGSKEKLPSAPNDGISDDWKYSDGFGYSPLSYIPSGSSQSDTASSSQITISQESQQEDPRNTCQSGNMKKRSLDTFIIDDDIASNVSTIEDDEIPRVTSITQKKNPDSKSNSEKVDLICEETDNFLSPCNKRRDASKPTSGKSSNTRDQQSLDVLQNSQDVGVSNLSPVETKEEQTRERIPVKYCPTQSLTNSFKWKAFVTGQTFSENPTSLDKERKVKQTPTKTMSSVCQQVLQEVMQLDRELIQQSPYLGSTSKSGSLTSMMGFTSIQVTKPKMEEYSLPHTKGTEVENVQTGDWEPDNNHLREYVEQQVPDQTDQHITSKILQIHSSLSDSSEQQDTEDDENSYDGENSTVYLQDCNQRSQENKEGKKASGLRNPATSDDKSGLEKSSPEPTDNDSQQKASCKDGMCGAHTDTSTLIICDSIVQNKATQCNVITENKETQYELTDCSGSLCVEASVIQENDVHTSDPSLHSDPYDGCKIC